MTKEAGGLALVVAGPSGGGKTTVCRRLVERRRDVFFSVSATTRAARTGEQDGRDYRFLSRPAFEALIETDALLEWAEVHGELYGTPRENLAEARSAGRHLLLDIDVQGAAQVRSREPDAVLVFLLPPSAEELLRRLRRRGSEDGEAVRRRMRTALAELEAVGTFDFVIVNDDLDRTVAVVEAILTAEGCRSERSSEALAARIRRLKEALEPVSGAGCSR
ncbi:MAG: guanylate kinase [Gemmatimonadota bacterium]|nr:guanylate kinase [Gemmatimonadota bacterium]